MSGARSSIVLSALVLLVACAPARPLVSGPHAVVSWALEPGSYDLQAYIVEDDRGLYEPGAVVLDEVTDVRVEGDWVIAEGPSGTGLIVRIENRVTVDAEGEWAPPGTVGTTTRLRLDLSRNESTLAIAAAPGRVEPIWNDDVFPNRADTGRRTRGRACVHRSLPRERRH